jgi:hypothetical protein
MCGVLEDESYSDYRRCIICSDIIDIDFEDDICQRCVIDYVEQPYDDEYGYEDEEYY